MVDFSCAGVGQRLVGTETGPCADGGGWEVRMFMVEDAGRFAGRPRSCSYSPTPTKPGPRIRLPDHSLDESRYSI